MSLRSQLITGLLAGVLSGCTGYYPSWHYAPGNEVHELHFKDGEAATIRVAARIVGILRPVGDGLRRVHAHLEIENRDPSPATLDPNLARLTPSGALPLSPDPGGAVVVAPSERRGVEIYFPLPDTATLPNASLLELDLAWTLQVGERALQSSSQFRRSSDWYGSPYPYDPYWYGGPYYYGPYYGGPYYGPYWGPYWGCGASGSIGMCH